MEKDGRTWKKVEILGLEGWSGGMLEGGHEEAESGGSLRGKQDVGSDELGWVRFASDSFVWVRERKGLL